MKCLYRVTRCLDHRPRLATMGNEVDAPAVNAFAITFNGRITPTGN
jgi:putative transposase